MSTVKITIWLPGDLVERVEVIEKRERRGSRSNAIVALVAEAIEKRDETAKKRSR